MPLHTRSCTWNTDERWREGRTDAGGGGWEREISEDGNRVGIGDWVVHVDRYCHWFSTFSVREREDRGVLRLQTQARKIPSAESPGSGCRSRCPWMYIHTQQQMMHMNHFLPIS